tara:strand:+ start:14402 stop:15277 length:876 start_codon:yes stop_codon:yes gene_type:complete
VKILLIGANGLIGTNLFYVLSKDNNYEIYCLIRDENKLNKFYNNFKFKNFLVLDDFSNFSKLKSLIANLKPQVIINCSGITKHNPNIRNMRDVIYLNALFPHIMASLSEELYFRFIHISSDCVFNGEKGLYDENALKDSKDSYGITKSLGEINDTRNLTIRTSTIGHEVSSSYGLLNWFLKQNKCKGYKNAIFSGPTTIELAKIIKNIIIPMNELSGLLNVASKPIDKYSLLLMIKDIYSLNTKIEPSLEIKVNRSLDSSKFMSFTNYSTKSWETMIKEMFLERNLFISNV